MIVARGLGRPGTPIAPFGWGILEDLTDFESLFAVTDINDNFLGVKAFIAENGLLLVKTDTLYENDEFENET